MRTLGHVLLKTVYCSTSKIYRYAGIAWYTGFERIAWYTGYARIAWYTGYARIASCTRFAHSTLHQVMTTIGYIVKRLVSLLTKRLFYFQVLITLYFPVEKNIRRPTVSLASVSKDYTVPKL